MRLWSLHPSYLDPKGLVALWREGLLARAVLRGETRGYRHHPQLERFRAHPDPVQAINAYLCAVHAEASTRGYAFDRSKIEPCDAVSPIEVTTGQLACEWAHLLSKLAVRSPECYARLATHENPLCHPLFVIRPGPVEPWERAQAAPGE
ncbi:pyrimidine dimer DNA glycosylase/endonuclease V [Noviherbaspirillum massiliense]|uniref:pyrimidine dimer DNA glycosylase/endonuclease V n=1 Tax=Noviherbaspirillum massiliense TaxID=1465823 RepID=UPI0002E9B3C2|nr:pyrimidine dimer DNA glycosylase/endonuclease V [Noviherbaspirillum massiliense]